MSDYFDDGDAEAEEVAPARRRRAPRVTIVLGIVIVLIIVLSMFTSVWTQKLWYQSLGAGSVYGTLLATRAGLFVVFGGLMALVVGANLAFAIRLRPLFRPRSAEQANLERYRDLITPVRRPLVLTISVIVGLFAGGAAVGQWRSLLMWWNAVPFHEQDPWFHKDIGFYVFDLPWWHFVVDFAMTATVLGLIAAVTMHYVYGGIRLQTPGDRVARGARTHVCVLLGILVLLKGVAYYLDRYDLTSRSGGLITGMTYARQHAVLPSQNALMAIAVVCALLFFANIWRTSWLLPGVAVSLFAIAALLLGVIWPAVVEKFQVKPNEPDKEAPYLAANIAATRLAYGIKGATVKPYDVAQTLSPARLAEDSASLPGVRLMDPSIVSTTFQQLQQWRNYYTVPSVLDVDHYDVDGTQRDMVIAARELNLAGLPSAQRKWTNDHTVYTHGYGLIAAYGNQRNQQDQPETNGGDPIFAEKDIPTSGVLGNYQPRIYFGENSPAYSIVGHPAGAPDVELDYPQGKGDSGNATTSVYHGRGGVPVGSLFHKLLYAVKFGDANIVLSSRVNPDSKILYDRSPQQRVEKLAPWLTLDSDPYPAVVNGRIQWIIDGYTTTDRFPGSEKRSMQDMTSDAISPRSSFAALPSDQINYIRNSVKATVDAYDGTVHLYAWDAHDPILQTMEKAFPHLVEPRSAISPQLMQHLRYPEDLFKVQRNILAQYHVTNPTTFFSTNDQWQVPVDPSSQTRYQPPYRLSVATAQGATPVFSLTSVYTPYHKENLAAFISVGADPASPATYGKIEMLRLPDNTQVPGPSQIANTFISNENVAQKLQSFKRSGARVEYGNLLTLPVGGGLLYVEPVYASRSSGNGNYPVLRLVLASFGKQVGVGNTLSQALDGIVGTSTSSTGSGSNTGTGSGSGSAPLPVEAIKLLQRADEEFRSADQALKSGDLQAYAKRIAAGRDLVNQALAVGESTDKSSGKPTASPSAAPTKSASR